MNKARLMASLSAGLLLTATAFAGNDVTANAQAAKKPQQEKQSTLQTVKNKAQEVVNKAETAVKNFHQQHLSTAENKTDSQSSAKKAN